MSIVFMEYVNPLSFLRNKPLVRRFSIKIIIGRNSVPLSLSLSFSHFHSLSLFRNVASFAYSMLFSENESRELTGFSRCIDRIGFILVECTYRTYAYRIQVIEFIVYSPITIFTSYDTLVILRLVSYMGYTSKPLSSRNRISKYRLHTHTRTRNNNFNNNNNISIISSIIIFFFFFKFNNNFLFFSFSDFK